MSNEAMVETDAGASTHAGASTSPPTLGLTPWQRGQRKGRLTASKAAAWMGFNPHRTAYDVWLEETGRAPESGAGEAAEIGLRVEPYLLDWASGRLGRRIIRNQWRTGGHARLGATCDAVFEDDGGPLEAKVVGAVNYKSLNMAEWGEDGSDQVPDRFLIQVTVQIICTGAERAFLAALLAGHGQRLYVIERNASIVDAVFAAADDFDRAIRTDTPPASAPSLDVIQSARRASGRRVTISADVAAAYVAANARRKQAEDEEEAARALLLAAMRDADGEYVDEAEFAGGLVTYRQNKPSQTFDAKRFERENPQVAAQFAVTKPGARVLRVLPAKGGGM